jgi:membrane fusion protein (multidrug efflux system)
MTNSITTSQAPWLFLLTASLAVAGCGGGGGTSTSSSAGKPTAANADTLAEAGADSTYQVRAVVVQPGLNTRSLFTTFLEPVVDAPVVARHDGIVQSVEVMEGQRVGEGAVLARLEDDEQRLDWERADALADQAEAAFERAKKLQSREVISDHELELAEAEARVARAEAGRAKLDYERCTLRAPIAGVVRLVRAEPHEIVEEGEILFRVVDPSGYRASLYLPTSLRTQLKRGDRVQVVSAMSASHLPAPGRVRLVNPISNPVTGLFRVEIDIAPTAGLEAGSQVRVVLGTETTPGPVTASGLFGAILPLDTYLERAGDQLYLYRLADGQAQRLAVGLGELGPDGHAVLSGVSAGELVLAAGELPPPDGANVKPHLVSDTGP